MNEVTNVQRYREALACFESGRYGKTIAILASEIPSAGHDSLAASILTIRGLAHYLRDEADEAFSDLNGLWGDSSREPVEPYELPVDVWLKGGVIHARLLVGRGKLSSAECLLKRIFSMEGCAESETSITARRTVAWIMRQEERHAEAVDALRDVIPRAMAAGYCVYPERESLARSLLALGRREEAREEITAAITGDVLQEDMARLMSVAAKIAKESGKLELARDYVREAAFYLKYVSPTKRWEEEAEPIASMAWNLDEHVVTEQLSRRLASGSGGARTLGVTLHTNVLHELARYDECLSLCEEELSIEQHDREFVRHLRRLAVYCAAHLGKRKEAIEHARQAEASGVTFDDDEELKDWLGTNRASQLKRLKRKLFG